MKKAPESPANAFTFKVSGSTIHRRFDEAFRGFVKEMKSQGYAQLGHSEGFQSFSDRPGAWKTKYRGTYASAFGPPEFIQIIALLAEPVSKAVIEVFALGFMRAALSRFKKLFSSKTKDREAALRFPIRFRPAIWLDSEEVLITVIADIESPGDFKAAEQLIPRAFYQATKFLERRSVTHPYVTYRIKNGKLNNIPTLSADEPSPE